MPQMAQVQATTCRHLFEFQSKPNVEEACALSAWMLDEIAANPDAYPAVVREVFAEVAAEADQELVDRGLFAAGISMVRPEDTLRRIKERVDLAGYVARRTGAEYRQSGAELKTRCPFPDHADKSPSFFVDSSKELFHCFGCGRGGDIVTFVMAWDGYSFKETVTLLLHEAGLPALSSAQPPRLVPTGTEGGWVPTPIRGGGRYGR